MDSALAPREFSHPETVSEPAPPLDRATRLWYGLGQFSEGLKNEAYTVFLLFYYTSVIGLSGLLAGQAILIALLFDAFTDPMVGSLSDRMESRFGRRHPFLFASAIPLPLDRKSTRLNSSHVVISYAVFCLKKKIQSVDVTTS